MEGIKNDAGKIQWSLAPAQLYRNQFSCSSLVTEDLIRCASPNENLIKLVNETIVHMEYESSYVTSELIVACMVYGANKYSRNNWKKGIKCSRLLDAAMRHWVSNYSDDPETGIPHAAHAAANMYMLQWMIVNKPEFNDLEEQQ